MPQIAVGIGGIDVELFKGLLRGFGWRGQTVHDGTERGTAHAALQSCITQFAGHGSRHFKFDAVGFRHGGGIFHGVAEHLQVGVGTREGAHQHIVQSVHLVGRHTQARHDV
ncbi:hypothetical protein D3C80_1801160 [compost metagenome]